MSKDGQESLCLNWHLLVFSIESSRFKSPSTTKKKKKSVSKDAQWFREYTLSNSLLPLISWGLYGVVKFYI